MMASHKQDRCVEADGSVTNIDHHSVKADLCMYDAYKMHRLSLPLSSSIFVII